MSIGGMNYRLTDDGRAALRAVLDASALERDADGYRPSDGAAVDLPDEWCEPLPPPLPPEPGGGEHGVWLIGDMIAVCVGDGRWAVPALTTAGNRMQWAEVCEAVTLAEGVTVRRLVPAPEPVTLPWQADSGLTFVRVGARGPDARGIHDHNQLGGDCNVTLNLTPAEARAKAAALLTAADQAEAAS